MIDFPWVLTIRCDVYNAISVDVLRIPGSFGYDVYYRCVPGLTFEMCQACRNAVFSKTPRQSDKDNHS